MTRIFFSVFPIFIFGVLKSEIGVSVGGGGGGGGGGMGDGSARSPDQDYSWQIISIQPDHRLGFCEG